MPSFGCFLICSEVTLGYQAETLTLLVLQLQLSPHVSSEYCGPSHDLIPQPPVKHKRKDNQMSPAHLLRCTMFNHVPKHFRTLLSDKDEENKEFVHNIHSAIPCAKCSQKLFFTSGFLYLAIYLMSLEKQQMIHSM